MFEEVSGQSDGKFTTRLLVYPNNRIVPNSAYLCVPLRLCGESIKKSIYRRDAEERKDTQRRNQNDPAEVENFSTCH